MHAAAHEIRCAITVEVADGERDQMRRRAREIMHRKLLAPVVLQPDKTLGRGVAPLVVGADDHDIEVSVAIDVGCLRA